jgi:signal transduction histidine kinase
MSRRIRLGVRTRLLLAVVGVVSLALVIGVTAFNLLLDQRLAASATALARGQALATLSALDVVDGKVVAPEARDDGAALGSPVWIFSGTTPIETPRAQASVAAVAASLANGPEHTVRVGEKIRLYAVPVVDHGQRVGEVVAGVSLDPYDETATIAFIGSIVLAFTLLGAITLLTWWILGKALQPVSRMTEDAAAWSDHDLDKRFDLGDPYDELTQLAATLDTLLERLSASLRHEQRFTSELSHELRTPLAKIVAESEIALRRKRSDEDYRASLEAVHRNAEYMTRTVDALVAAARQEADPTGTAIDARQAVREATASVQDEADVAGIEIHLTVPVEPVTVAIEDDLLERIIVPLLDNAIRYGESEISVALARNGRFATIDVHDDGMGVRADERDRIFEPGARGRAAGTAPKGAGLGLALARRLARSAGGEIAVTADERGGNFSVRLPVA